MAHKIGIPVAATPPTLAMLKADALEGVAEFAEGIRQTLTGGASPTEIAAWPNKAERARRFIASTASATDIEALGIEAALRGLGETPLELAQLQLAREASYAKAVGYIDGLTSAARGAIEAATEETLPQTIADLQVQAATAMTALGL